MFNEMIVKKYFRPKGKFIKILILLTLFSHLQGCSLFPTEESIQTVELVTPKAVEYNSIVVKRADFNLNMKPDVTFGYNKQQNLFFTRSGGILTDVYFEEGDVVKKGDVLAEIEAADLNSEIKQQEIKVQIAQISYEALKNKSTDEMERKKSELLLEFELEKLKFLRESLNETKLVSSINGIVVFANKMSINQAVDASTLMFSIAQPEDLIMAYNWWEKGNMILSKGEQVGILYNQKKYNGETISDIKLESGRTINRDPIRIRLNQIPEDVILNKSVSVVIDYGVLKNVIAVPKAALKGVRGSEYVIILKNGARIQKSVTTEGSNISEVVISSGLNEGDIVIIDER